MQPQPSVPQQPQQPQPAQQQPAPRPGMPDEFEVPDNKLLRYLGTAFVSVIGAFAVLFTLHLFTTKSRPQRVPEPLVKDRFVFRPEFETPDGKFQAGTAFAVKKEGDSRTIVLTVVNLFGERGGFPREVPAVELPGYIQKVNLTNAFDDEALLGTASEVIPIPAAGAGEPPEESPPGDVAAFILDPDANIVPMPLGSLNPPADDTIWLVAKVLGGAPEDRRMHRAIVTGYDAGDILYRFVNNKLDLVATGGAPLVNSAGEVIGIHIGPAGTETDLLGFGNPVERFAKHVKLPQLEEPKKPDENKKDGKRPPPPVVRPPKPP